MEERLKRRLTALEQEIDTYARLDWEEKIKGYVADLQAGIEGLNRTVPQTAEEQHRIFVVKKQLADELVAEAMIDGKRDIQVECRAKIMDPGVSRQVLDLSLPWSYCFHHLNTFLSFDDLRNELFL